MFYVSLNPKKATRFTTQGINLTKRKPMAYVDSKTMDPLCYQKVLDAIANDELVKIDNVDNINIPNFGGFVIESDDLDDFIIEVEDAR